MPHIHPSDAAGAALFRRFGDETTPFLMLNLLRFRDIADYSHAPDIAPAAPISGAEAYARYKAEITPLLRASGGDVVLAANGGDWFIGPEGEYWHHVLVVQQASVTSFFAFAGDPAAIAATRHRTAALADSRLLPMLPDAPLALPGAEP